MESCRSRPVSTDLIITVGVMSDLAVSFALVGLTFEAANRSVTDDGGFFGEGWDSWRLFLWTVDVRKGRSGWGILFSLK